MTIACNQLFINGYLSMCEQQDSGQESLRMIAVLVLLFVIQEVTG